MRATSFAVACAGLALGVALAACGSSHDSSDDEIPGCKCDLEPPPIGTFPIVTAADPRLVGGRVERGISTVVIRYSASGDSWEVTYDIRSKGP